jgi:hypothetical protein
MTNMITQVNNTTFSYVTYNMFELTIRTLQTSLAASNTHL